MKHSLVIDDSKFFRSYIAKAVLDSWPDAEVEEYDPIARGHPPDDFPWDRYDVVLLDFNLGLVGEDGLDWLRGLRSLTGHPIVIMLTGEGSESVAVRAMKLGADDYVTKGPEVVQKVITAIEEAMDFRANRLRSGRETPTDRLVPFSTMDVGAETDKRETTHAMTPAELNAAVSTSGKAKGEALEDNGSTVPMPAGYRFVTDISAAFRSVVLLSERKDNRQKVVLKFLDTTRVNEDPSALKRFIQEYALISSINHIHVARIHEQNFTLNHAYIAMEYFPKGNLTQQIEAGISLNEAAGYLREIAYGLQAVHNLGIVHRDLKPANILFRQDGSLAITDFGIAKILDGRHDLTQQGVVLGTPYYMSPEQAVGKEVDQRGDLYSLGVVLYQMLMKKRPFDATTVHGLLYAHVYQPVPSLSSEASVFQPFIDKLLAKDPEERYPDADSLLENLGELRIA